MGYECHYDDFPRRESYTRKELAELEAREREIMTNIRNELLRKAVSLIFTPKGIYHNRNTKETIVLWKDGTKTKVKPMEGQEESPYFAFTAALAKKIFGSNTQVGKIVDMTCEPEKKDSMFKTTTLGESKEVKKEVEESNQQEGKERW